MTAVAGIEISNPDKVLFPEPGVTKLELARHYERVAGLMLPHVRDRPVTLHAFPRGIDGPGHFIKNRPKGFPDWVATATLPKRGGEVTHVLANDVRSLVLLAQHNCITPHVWTSRVDRPDHPDRLVVDLDPTAEDEFPLIRKAARMLGDMLRAIGLAPFAMTTGSRGIHVVAPLQRECGFDEVFALGKALSLQAAAASPDTLTTEFLKRERGGRIYVDIQRNRWAQTVPAPYAVRPRPAAPVAVPLRWDELSSARLTTAQRWTIQNLGRRLGRVGDPWADIDDAAGSPRDARKRLG